MAKGIKDLHKQDIIIVDFKCDNVLIKRKPNKEFKAYITDFIKRKPNKEFKAYITDFSLALFKGRGYTSMMSAWKDHQDRHGNFGLTGQNNSTAFCMAFPQYAPELLGDTIDKAVDIYSVGKLLCQVMAKSSRLRELLKPLADRCTNMKASERPPIKKVVTELKELRQQCKVGKVYIHLIFLILGNLLKLALYHQSNVYTINGAKLVILHQCNVLLMPS